MNQRQFKRGTFSAVTVQEVFPGNYLGLVLRGETRDADGQVWGDVEIEGLTNDVSSGYQFVSLASLTCCAQFWHVWGSTGKIHVCDSQFWLRVFDSPFRPH